MPVRLKIPKLADLYIKEAEELVSRGEIPYSLNTFCQNKKRKFCIELIQELEKRGWYSQVYHLDKDNRWGKGTYAFYYKHPIQDGGLREAVFEALKNA